jgi:hypothetical protein
MGVRSADEYSLRQDAAAVQNRLPHLQHQVPRDHQGIDAHQRSPHLAVVENGRPDLALIVEAAMKGFAITAGLLHAQFRRNIAFRKAGLEYAPAWSLSQGGGRCKLQKLASLHNSHAA